MDTASSVEIATGAVEVVQADHLGSVRTTTDAAGTVTATARYDEFGVPLAATGSASSPFGFTGEQTDPTGLIHLRARAYDPTLGRFLSRDSWPGVAPMPASLNRYTYVANNPVRHTDPGGRCGVDVIADVAFSIGSGWATITGPDKERASNALGFLLDVFGIAIPCFGGGGTALRAATHLADAGRLAGNPGDIAKAFGTSVRAVRTAIHAVKDAARGELEGNPDIRVDVDSGDVYPIRPDGSISDDSIGNILDFLTGP